MNNHNMFVDSICRPKCCKVPKILISASVCAMFVAIKWWYAIRWALV